MADLTNLEEKLGRGHRPGDGGTGAGGKVLKLTEEQDATSSRRCS